MWEESWGYPLTVSVHLLGASEGRLGGDYSIGSVEGCAELFEQVADAAQRQRDGARGTHPREAFAGTMPGARRPPSSMDSNNTTPVRGADLQSFFPPNSSMRWVSSDRIASPLTGALSLLGHRLALVVGSRRSGASSGAADVGVLQAEIP